MKSLKCFHLNKINIICHTFAIYSSVYYCQNILKIDFFNGSLKYYWKMCYYSPRHKNWQVTAANLTNGYHTCKTNFRVILNVFIYMVYYIKLLYESWEKMVLKMISIEHFNTYNMLSDKVQFKNQWSIAGLLGVDDEGHLQVFI